MPFHSFSALIPFDGKVDVQVFKVEYSSVDNNFKSLYGLTPVVEDAIKLTIKKKNRQGLKKLIEPLHPADQADMIERLSGENLNSFLNLLGKALDPEVLVLVFVTPRTRSRPIGSSKQGSDASVRMGRPPHFS